MAIIQLGILTMVYSDIQNSRYDEDDIRQSDKRPITSRNTRIVVRYPYSSLRGFEFRGLVGVLRTVGI